MPLDITQYVDPGVYIGEQVVPGAVSAATVPLSVCLVGIASRNKRVSNEALTRGLVSNETLTVSSTPGAHDATLINISNRQSAQTLITKDTVAIDSTFVTFRPATKTGLGIATLDLTAPNNKLSLALDGKQPVTIAITGSGGDLTTITGTLITQRLGSIGAIAAVTRAQIAEAINKALTGASSLGYGSAYGAVAADSGSAVVVTSPVSTPLSDLRFYASYPTAQDRTDEIMTASLPFQAPTVIRVDNSQYTNGAVYKASYVATNTDIDVLANTNVQTMVRVGSFAGVTSFKENVDYTRSASNLDWSADAAAAFTSSIASATFDVSTNDTIVLALDGKGAVTIDLNGLGSPPPGYANPSSAAAATGAELVNNINAVLANTVGYGPEYRGVATFASLMISLTSPRQGTGSFVQVAAPTTLSAVTALFGLASSQLPYSLAGTGTRPASGAIYFSTYEFTRPSTDYNVMKRYFTPDAMYGDLGFPLTGNSLAIAGSIAFENSAPSVIVIQVNDQNFPGAPTQTELLTGIQAAQESASPTEMCVLSTALATQVDLMNHVVNMNSPTEKNYRRGWFGMARNTQVGDKDTPDTYVYRSMRTLQVPGDSPGRGRLVLCAPANVQRTITKEDGTIANLDLDGSYVAVAVAAKMTSFTGAAETLLRKNVSGFKIDTFETFLKAQRKLLAGNGVTVVTLDAGKLILLDPMSTEGGGGKLPSFQEISASTQKDGVTTAVNQSVDANLVGVVPTDLATFIITIKGFVGGVLRSLIASGAIGPFKTAEGVTRDIDFSKDIQVFQDATDPTKYLFRYFFNLRYPAKRFFGEYSVDNPFFQS